MIRAGAGSRPSRARSVMLLPEPDSPTRPTDSPGIQSQGDTTHGLQLAVRQRDLDLEVRDLEQRGDRRRAAAGIASLVKVVIGG